MKTTEIVITIKVPKKDGGINLRKEIGSAMCNNSRSEDFKNNNIFCNYTHIPRKIIYDADFTQCSDTGRIIAKRAIDNAVRDAFNATYESEVLSSESLDKLIYSIGEDDYINLHTFMTSTEVPLEKRNEVLKYIRNALNDNIETDEQEIGSKYTNRKKYYTESYMLYNTIKSIRESGVVGITFASSSTIQKREMVEKVIDKLFETFHIKYDNVYLYYHIRIKLHRELYALIASLSASLICDVENILSNVNMQSIICYLDYYIGINATLSDLTIMTTEDVLNVIQRIYHKQMDKFELIMTHSDVVERVNISMRSILKEDKKSNEH